MVSGVGKPTSRRSPSILPNMGWCISELDKEHWIKHSLKQKNIVGIAFFMYMDIPMHFTANWVCLRSVAVVMRGKQALGSAASVWRQWGFYPPAFTVCLNLSGSEVKVLPDWSTAGTVWLFCNSEYVIRHSAKGKKKLPWDSETVGHQHPFTWTVEMQRYPRNCTTSSFQVLVYMYS